MVSLVPLTGWSKQISLAQITFVGAGAFAFLQWAPVSRHHRRPRSSRRCSRSRSAWPWRCPALRLQGLYLALGVDGVRADGRHPVLPATRDPRLRRQADPVVEHPRVRLQPAVRLPRHRLRPGRRHPALHHCRARRRRRARRVAAQEPVRPAAHRAGRQPGRVRDPRRSTRSPPSSVVFVHLGRHRGVRRRAARHLPGHRHRAGLRDARRVSPTCCSSSWAASRS